MRSVFWFSALLALVAATPATAQIELVDPGAVKPQAKPVVQDVEEVPVEIPIAPERKDAGVKKEPVGKQPLKGKTATPVPVVETPAPPTTADVKVMQVTDAQLTAVWDLWRRAATVGSADEEAKARSALLRAAEDAGSAALEPFAVGLLRAALSRQAAGDSARAIDLAVDAVKLAPRLPAAHLGLLKVYAEVDPGNVGRIFDAGKTWVNAALQDPRTRRSLIADVGTALLTAICVLAMVLISVLFLRRARLFLHDFHFLFPRSLARWQSAAIAILLLLLPIVFRMGVALALLTAFAMVTLYLSMRERVVAVVLLAALGVVPTLASLLVRQTVFARTQAEVVATLDRGGPGSEAIAPVLAKLAEEDKASFPELFVLAAYELRRGASAEAVAHYKQALQKRDGDPRATNNLAVAMMVGGDYENPKPLLERVIAQAPELAAPHLNLARIYQRRIATLPPSETAADVDKVSVEVNAMKALDPALSARVDLPADRRVANRYFETVPLLAAELGPLASAPEDEERVRAQLTRTLVGEVPVAMAPFFPGVVALLVLALGFLAGPLEVARPCEKCGRAVSRRADPELSKGSPMCTQCVNVFARKGVVPPSLKVRKQIEVERYHQRVERFSYLLGLMCSGMGHVFQGSVIRGAFFGFGFWLLVFLFVQRDGVLRAAYDGAPLWVQVVPLVLGFVILYVSSLRALFRKGD